MEDLPIRAMPDDLARVNLGDPQTFADYDLSDYWRTLRATRPLYSNLLTGISSLPVRFEPVAADVEELVL